MGLIKVISRKHAIEAGFIEKGNITNRGKTLEGDLDYSNHPIYVWYIRVVIADQMFDYCQLRGSSRISSEWLIRTIDLRANRAAHSVTAVLQAETSGALITKSPDQMCPEMQDDVSPLV